MCLTAGRVYSLILLTDAQGEEDSRRGMRQEGMGGLVDFVLNDRANLRVHVSNVKRKMRSSERIKGLVK